MKIELRKPKLSDARRYYEILNNPDFVYFPAKPETIKAERDFLRNLKQRIKEGKEYSFAVLANGNHIGGAGIIINSEIPFICDIGYFIDKKYWGKGIATKVVSLLEDYIKKNLDIVRIEISMVKENKGSQKVAIKSGYKKEGIMRKSIKIDEKFYDKYLYSKIVK